MAVGTSCLLICARHANLLNVGHNDVVAGINVRGKLWLVLTTQAASDFCGGRPSTLSVASTTSHSRFLHAIWRKKSSFETPSLYADNGKPGILQQQFKECQITIQHPLREASTRGAILAITEDTSRELSRRTMAGRFQTAQSRWIMTSQNTVNRQAHESSNVVAVCVMTLQPRASEQGKRAAGSRPEGHGHFGMRDFIVSHLAHNRSRLCIRDWY